MGSKARLAKDLSPLINTMIKENQIKTYIEPFVGGANMIQHIICDTKIGSDNNEYLVHMWNAVKGGWIPPEEISKELYNEIKQNKDNFEKELVAVVGFCSTYNAKWFGGYAGKVDTKIGTVRDYYDEAVRNILKQVDQLKDVEFLNADYTHFSDYKNALIYCDPPYQGTTQYGTSNDFHYERFWDWVREMSYNNIVLVSEYNAPDDFEVIFEKTLTTTLDKNSRKKDTEKLFRYR
ncbi:DNA adenine methylase [Bacillus altitudinis]|uniref:DNA adenine methylase n=1 Tax=Bacillus altitudinis TaxID=293387 RepID=UPI001F33F349|nr:DNA adenine methylase [Bacillus altitudinis]